jgi:hypothetical protein
MSLPESAVSRWSSEELIDCIVEAAKDQRRCLGRRAQLEWSMQIQNDELTRISYILLQLF